MAARMPLARIVWDSPSPRDLLMGDLLTLEEIEAQYSGEWVLLSDIEEDPGPIFRRGRVLWHSADQDECWLKATQVAASNIGVLYFGPWSAEDEPIPVL